MINNEDLEILNNGIREIKKQYTQALLPEEKKLFKDEREYPGPGYHVHNEDNPTGKHRHSKDDSISGEHSHTVLNIAGQHTHEELEYDSLADGGHSHYYGGFGYHYHNREEDNTGKVIPEKPPSVL